jgi:DNA excision repair protein ERCC-6
LVADICISAGERLEQEERRKERELLEKQQDQAHEDHILKSLFEMTGIQSALQHDQIMDSASHDTVFVEREGTNIQPRRNLTLIHL